MRSWGRPGRTALLTAGGLTSPSSDQVGSSRNGFLYLASERHLLSERMRMTAATSALSTLTFRRPPTVGARSLSPRCQLASHHLGIRTTAGAMPPLSATTATATTVATNVLAMFLIPYSFPHVHSPCGLEHRLVEMHSDPDVEPPSRRTFVRPPRTPGGWS